MLVLTRKKGERITISPDITITIVRVVGGNVQLGIEAPRDRQVLRDDAKDRGNEVRGIVVGAEVHA